MTKQEAKIYGDMFDGEFEKFLAPLISRIFYYRNYGSSQEFLLRCRVDFFKNNLVRKFKKEQLAKFVLEKLRDKFPDYVGKNIKIAFATTGGGQTQEFYSEAL